MAQNLSSSSAIQPKLSMFDVYSGYVLTQGHNALQNVVMWERVMRGIAIVSILAIAALWLSPDGATGPQVLPLKLTLSVIMVGMSGMLFWASRSRAQYESQVDLIHGELRQVMRAASGAASGIEREMLRVDFGSIAGLFVKRNRDQPDASCLFLELDGAPEPILLGVSHHDCLDVVHHRLTTDLAKARSMPRDARPALTKRRAIVGVQAA